MRRRVLFSVLLIPVAGSLLEARRVPAAADQVNFSEHIAPIIFGNCTVCHHPGAAAPFPLLSYRDVFKRGRLIEEVTRTRYMPPWPAAQGWGEFQGERRLGGEEIDLIRQWVEGGMPQGDPALQPVAPQSVAPQFRDTWKWGEPDLVVTIEEPYAVPPDGPDIYRNFAIDLGLSADRWLQAMAFHPTAKSAAHHALFFFDATGASRQIQSEDPEPGFALMRGGVFARQPARVFARTSVRAPAGWLGSWAVGREGWKVPNGFARHLSAGSDLVVQLHLHPSGKSEMERARVGFYFAEKPGREFTRLSLPVMFGRFAGIDIPGGVSDYVVEDSFVLPVDVEVLSASAHAHYLGKEMKMKATLPDGEEKGLLWLPDWDFSWQEQYQYKELLFLPRGTRIDVSISYDNSTGNPHNPSHPPKRVTWGMASTDEMGRMSLWVVPVIDSEAEVLQRVRWRAVQRAWVTQSLESPDAWESIPRRIRERFDADGDERLSDMEKEAIRKHLDDRLTRAYRSRSRESP